MRILVAGATGRVGSRLVPRLLAHGYTARVLARDADRAAPLRERGAEVVVGDLRHAGTLDAAVAGVDAVVNLAAAFRGVSEDETVATTHHAAVALARAGLSAGVRRYVFASTNLVYGPGRGRPAREDDTPHPGHAYPRSKVAAEQALRGLVDADGLDLRIARLAFVYGDGDPHLAESLDWARQWPAHQRLQLVHHADVAQAVRLMLHAEGIGGRTYNVADDAPVTAHELFVVNNRRTPPGAADRVLDDPWAGLVDTNLIRTELGYRPVYPTLCTARDAGAL